MSTIDLLKFELRTPEDTGHNCCLSLIGLTKSASQPAGFSSTTGSGLG